MNFSEALEVIKEGKSVKRSKWTDKGIALHARPYQIQKKILTGEETLHTSDLFIQAYEEGLYIPWSPTQRDLLSDDWEEIEPLTQKPLGEKEDKLSKLQKGKLYISKEEIIEKLGLTEDSVISSVNMFEDGIEFEVVASGENNKDWLVDSTSGMWNIRRHKLSITEGEIKKGIAIMGDKGMYIKGGLVTLNKGERVLNNKQTEELFTKTLPKAFGNADNFAEYKSVRAGEFFDQSTDDDSDSSTEEDENYQEKLWNLILNTIDERVEEAIKKNEKNKNAAERLIKSLANKDIQQ